MCNSDRNCEKCRNGYYVESIKFPDELIEILGEWYEKYRNQAILRRLRLIVAQSEDRAITNRDVESSNPSDGNG